MTLSIEWNIVRCKLQWIKMWMKLGRLKQRARTSLSRNLVVVKETDRAWAGSLQRTWLEWRRNFACICSLRDGEERENENAQGERGWWFLDKCRRRNEGKEELHRRRRWSWRREDEEGRKGSVMDAFQAWRGKSLGSSSIMSSILFARWKARLFIERWLGAQGMRWRFVGKGKGSHKGIQWRAAGRAGLRWIYILYLYISVIFKNRLP